MPKTRAANLCHFLRRAAKRQRADSLRSRDVWTEVNGVRTYARVQGSGPALVLVPGLACSHLYYTRLQAQLAPHFEVWAYDPPGHGGTPAERDAFLTVEALTEHLAAWLQATGLSGAPLFGHSLGGQVLLHLAAHFPQQVSRLVLCAPSGRPDSPSAARQIRRLLLDARYERPDFLLRVLRSYLQAGPYRAWHLLQAGHRDNPLRLAPQVQVPVLILEGGHDDVIRRQALLKLELALPHATRTRLPDGGHALHDRCPERVAELVTGFLSTSSLHET